ncbi:hypothetical protein OG900_09805 [Streptomyces sp. NBC_00433]
MSGKTLPAGTRITLAFSTRVGIVAVTSGTRYQEADTLLTTAGFTRREDGTSTLSTADADTARRALTALTRLTADQDMTLTASSRAWLGDTATRIAALLPGQWHTRIEVYALPVWQADLDGTLWDAGALATALRSDRVPHAAVLADGRGTELLMADRPGHSDELLIGAFVHADLLPPPREDPGGPHSITTTTDPAIAAHAITGRLLPAYRAAVYQRRAQEVATHLAHALNTGTARPPVRGEGHAEVNPGPEPDANDRDRLEHRHREDTWSDFLPFLVHGQALLDHLQTALLTREEHAALAGLREALRHGENVRDSWTAALRYTPVRPDLPPADETYAEAVAARNAQAGPALAAWLEHGPALVDLAHRHPPTGEPSVIPRALPPAPPAGPPGRRRGTAS